MPKTRLACLALAAAAAGMPAHAQQKNAAPAAKKLYCWDENGTRVCGDALPAEAANSAREEFSARSGLRTATVQRALTDEERANAALDAEQRRLDAAAAETRRRTELAMLTSYGSEDELRRVFNERTGIVDNNVKTAQFNIASLRDSLVILLQTAAGRELAGQKIPDKIVADIGKIHGQLQQQLRQQAEFQQRRVELDAEIEQIMVRYRELKGVAAATGDVGASKQ